MLPNRDAYIEKIFPRLFQRGYTITSPQDLTYNCIGWAATNKRWWEPDVFFQHYWPAQIPRVYTPEAYRMAYETLGFKLCDTSDYEDGYEKIAIFVDQATNQVKHASRQLNKNTWTSKLGQNYDISHAIDSLNGDDYASPTFFMKREI